MDRTKVIERRIEKIKRDLAKLDDMRPGSLSVQRRSWGGQYFQLSYTHQGKGHTQYVAEEHKKRVERQLANFRKFRELTQEWVELGIEYAQAQDAK